MSVLFWVQFLFFALLALLQVQARPSASGDATGDQNTLVFQEAIPFRHFYDLPSGFHPKRSDSWAQMLGDGMDVAAGNPGFGFMNYKGLRG
ncbi:hypothetical protein FO519_005871 [Halicephalobus sp. NKZ332]|nr:hypothetical protein FO519_005871 [Halicephalobus sp. NKZ332]